MTMSLSLDLSVLEVGFELEELRVFRHWCAPCGARTDPQIGGNLAFTVMPPDEKLDMSTCTLHGVIVPRAAVA